MLHQSATAQKSAAFLTQSGDEGSPKTVHQVGNHEVRSLPGARAGRVRLSFRAVELVVAEEQNRGVRFPALGLVQIHDLDRGSSSCPCPDQSFVSCPEQLLLERGSVETVLSGVTKRDTRPTGRLNPGLLAAPGSDRVVRVRDHLGQPHNVGPRTLANRGPQVLCESLQSVTEGRVGRRVEHLLGKRHHPGPLPLRGLDLDSQRSAGTRVGDCQCELHQGKLRGKGLTIRLGETDLLMQEAIGEERVGQAGGRHVGVGEDADGVAIFPSATRNVDDLGMSLAVDVVGDRGGSCRRARSGCARSRICGIRLPDVPDRE